MSVKNFGEASLCPPVFSIWGLVAPSMFTASYATDLAYLWQWRYYFLNFNHIAALIYTFIKHIAYVLLG